MKEMKSEKEPEAMADFHFSRYQRWARKSQYHLNSDTFSSAAPKCHQPSAKFLFSIYTETAPVISWLRPQEYQLM